MPLHATPSTRQSHFGQAVVRAPDSGADRVIDHRTACMGTSHESDTSSSGEQDVLRVLGFWLEQSFVRITPVTVRYQ